MDRIRAELEAAVRASWAYDDLVVYADHLQAVGDVRGELMALDLAPPADRNSAAAQPWRERRRALIATWLGGAPREVAEVVADHFELGFIKELPDEAAAAVWASAAGDCVRAATVQSAEVAAAIGARERPWLVRLAIEIALEPADAAAVIAATPNLATVDLGIYQEFSHPTVRRARLRNGHEGVLPAVTHVEIEAQGGDNVDDLGELPALTSLDLSRVTGTSQAVALVVIAASVGRVRELVLPALVDEAAVLAAGRILDRAPMLERVRFARGHGGAAVFGQTLVGRIPGLVLPEPFPWPPPRPPNTPGIATLIFRLPEEPFDDIVELDTLIEFLEASFDGMPERARGAWTRIFEYVRPADPENTGYDDDTGDWVPEPAREPVPLRVVAEAADACAALAASSRGWARFAMHLADARRGGVSDAAPVILAMYRR